MLKHGFCPSKEGWGPWSSRRDLDLTPCFERGVIVPALNLLFVALAVYRIRTLQRTYRLPSASTKTTAYWIKLVLSSVIACLAFAELAHLGLRRSGGLRRFNVFIASQLLQAIAYSLAVRLHHYEHTRTRRSSDILLLFWLASLVVGLLTLRTDRQTSRPSEAKHPIVWALRYSTAAAMAALFAAELWPRKVAEYVLLDDDDNDLVASGAPEGEANIFSRLTFSWMSPLLVIGQHKQIREGDLWALPGQVAPLNVAERFGDHWQNELDQSTPARQPSLVRALWRTMGWPFALAGLFKLIQDVLQFSQPVLLSRLIGFVASYATNHPQPVSDGYFYAASMLVLQVVQTVFLHQYFQLGMTTGMKAKSSLTTAIYRKALRLSNDTRQKYTTGSITTLFSVDVERIGGVTDYGHIVWSGPLQVILAIVLLYSTLGWSVFAGIVIMVLSIPVNGWITKRMRDLQLVQMKNKDRRTTLIDEALSGVKVIKLYAWERAFLAKIQNVRETLELVTLSRYGRMFALGSMTSIVVPFLVSFATFLIYSLFDNKSHGPLTAQLVFVSLSLFNLLRFPLTMFPIILSSVVDASVALTRVYGLLTSDELDTDAVARLPSVRNSNGSNEPAVAVRSASFRWSHTGPLILDNIDFAVRSNEHLAIIGRVGAGKSSLAAALLGNMRLERGSVSVHGQVAYAPQQPWIMNGLLRSRCRIHVTNALQFVPRCDSAMLLSDGRTVEQGTIDGLLDCRGPVYALLQEFGHVESSESGNATPTVGTLSGGSGGSSSVDLAGSRRRSTANTLPPASIAPMQRTGQLHSIVDHAAGPQQALITEEISAVGKVSTSAYVDYFRSCTWAGTAMFIGGMVLNQGFLVISNVWLKVWASANELSSSGGPPAHSTAYYISIYGILGLAASIFCYLRSDIQWSVCAVRSGRTTHQKMLESVFHSPMSFFDTTPLGRILQRFSKDQNSVDEVIPKTVSSWTQNLFSIILSLLVIVLSLPAFGLVMVPVLLFFFYLKNYFLLTSRTLKRLDSTTRSPIYASFQESLVGAATIRAYGQSDRFMAENLRKVDSNQRCVYPYLSLNRWLAVRLEFMSAFIIFATALLGVLSLLYGKGDAGLVGLSVTYALQSTQQINWMLRMECDLENSMCDYVRIQEFQDLPSEAPEVIEHNRPAKSWPEQGMVEFKGYSTRYREGLDLVLKDLSFRVEPRQKVGIAGRTGAGKSSLTLALFRIIEAAGGQILIDGEDIAQYGLYDVRSKLSIIPQDPVLFAGTVRENLDPFNSYSDQEIWRALEHAHLADVVRSKDEGLEFVVTQGGENFSVGQRQLICLARALLKRAKVLVLDEATAAIDNSTDAIIQESIRKEFKDCTVLTIAHRLNTIIDSDMILVVDAGKLAEYDTPENLLANENSLFAKLVEEARNTDAQK
ncbi:hypothetical protein FB645_003108 [Coemansia sp. IMI 203386]|nr:hypothetical protein FB645_003108 [Coemansia sp. IMI 203386]